MIDEPQEERASLYALGLLEGTELTQFQGMLAGQPELRSLVDQLVAAASSIAFIAPAMEPPTALKDRLMAQIATLPTPAPPAGYVLPFRLSFWVPLAARRAKLKLDIIIRNKLSKTERFRPNFAYKIPPTKIPTRKAQNPTPTS